MGTDQLVNFSKNVLLLHVSVIDILDVSVIINTSRSLSGNMVKREKVNSAISRELLRKVYSGSKGAGGWNEL